jgi:hypothetical protein
MTKPMTRIIDGNKITDREMTDEEFAAYEIVQADNAASEARQVAAQAAKDLQRQAVLDKLGLSADEAQALLG